MGGWEHLRDFYIFPRGGDLDSWAYFCELSNMGIVYFNETLRMLFDNIFAGNREGAEWMCDSFVKLWEKNRRYGGNLYYRIKDFHDWSLDAFQMSAEEVASKIGIDAGQSIDSPYFQSVYSVCIGTYPY